MKKVSVVVTTYNRLDYLKSLILCLIEQTKQIEELIIADDGSSEDVEEVIKELIPSCNFKIKFITQEDKGFRLSRSRNNGVRIATGDIILFLDQDCIFSNTLIEEVEKKLKKESFMVFKILWSSEEEAKEIKKIMKNKIDFKEIIKKIDFKKLKKQRKSFRQGKLKNFKYKIGLKDRGTNIVGAAFAFYKEDYIRINGFDEEYTNWGKEDDDISWRAYKSGLKSKLIKQEYPIIHMYHYSDPTKGGDRNESFFLNKKSKLNKLNYRCLYGYDNQLDKDSVKIKKLN